MPGGVMMENRQEPQGFDGAEKTGPFAALAPSLDPSSDPREQFGEFLRDRRVAAQLSIDSISRTTKIPRLSLEHLEAGRFEELPGDVFVRGFLRSYARCVGIDGDDLVDEYALCGLRPAPVSSDLADTLVSSKLVSSKRRRAVPTTRPEARCSEDTAKLVQIWRSAFDTKKAVKAKDAPTAEKTTVEATQDPTEAELASAPVKRVRTFIPPSLGFEEEKGARRGALTLGVIMLVIVATVTMSFLLQRPGSSSDGFTMFDPGLSPDSSSELAVEILDS